MIQTLTWWEIGLAAVVVMLGSIELVTLGMARGTGRTQNWSRLLTHACVLVGAATYAFFMLRFAAALEGVNWTNYTDLPDANWPFVIVLSLIGLVIGQELIAHLRAVRAGLTQNVSRLMSKFAMLLLLVVMIGIGEIRWQLYIDHIKELSERPPPPAAHYVFPAHTAPKAPAEAGSEAN